MTATLPPPRPPALDAGRAAAARTRLAPALASALGALAAEVPDDGESTPVYAGCRLLAWMLADLPGAYARRDIVTIERVSREVEGLARRLPGHLADARTPGSWAKYRPADIDPENPGPVMTKRRRYARRAA
jgi:hypothetical protein